MICNECVKLFVSVIFILCAINIKKKVEYYIQQGKKHELMAKYLNDVFLMNSQR